MAEAIKEQLDAMMRQTAQLRGLEPAVANRDRLDIEDITDAVANLLKTYRTARPHLIALWLAVVTLAGAFGLDWFTPPTVAPEQITQAVRSYVESVPLRSAAPPAGVGEIPFASTPAAQSGEPAEVSIVGPSTALPGDLIVLEAAGTFDSAKWFLGNSEKTFLPVDGGKRVVFASGASGEYRFFVVAATVDGGKVSLDDATHVVTIGGPNPTPTPPSPTPPAPPTPVPPTPVVPAAKSVAIVVIRDSEQLDADQSEVLVDLREWSDAQKPEQVRHYEFAPDQTGPDGRKDPLAAAYIAKLPANAALPWAMILNTDQKPAAVVWSEHLPDKAQSIIDKATSILKGGA